MRRWQIEQFRIKVWIIASMMCAFIVSTATDAGAQTPLGSEWTYQGEVSMGGSPLGGTADFEFTVWDHKTTGNMIGPTIAKNNVAVTNGRFTVQLDAGVTLFNGDRRWLEIAVRSPAGGGAFTILNPRQPLTAAPYAEYAKNGSLWSTSGSTMHYDGGFVGVGRSNPVTNAEVFGIHRASSGFGGMYASTGAGGWPFYGYDNAAESGYHYLDSTGNWHLVLDGDRLTVTDDGNVGIGTQAPTSPLHVQASASPATLMTTSGNVAVHGETSSSNGNGVFGFASSFSGATFGVYGRTQSPDGRGVLGWSVSGTGNSVGVYGVSNSGAGWDFYAGGAGQDYGSSSSRRWKSNVRKISQPLDKISQLRGVYFDWDSEHGGHHDLGMIAEEVGAVLPEIVQYEDNGIDASGMDYSKMTPLLVEAINALRSENGDKMAALRAEKNTQINELVSENESLRARLGTLEQAVSTLIELAEKENRQ